MLSHILKLEKKSQKARRPSRRLPWCLMELISDHIGLFPGCYGEQLVPGKFICDSVPHSSVCHNFSVLVLKDLVLDEALCSWYYPKEMRGLINKDSNPVLKHYVLTMKSCIKCLIYLVQGGGRDVNIWVWKAQITQMTVYGKTDNIPTPVSRNCTCKHLSPLFS